MSKEAFESIMRGLEQAAAHLRCTEKHEHRVPCEKCGCIVHYPATGK